MLTGLPTSIPPQMMSLLSGQPDTVRYDNALNLKTLTHDLGRDSNVSLSEEAAQQSYAALESEVMGLAGMAGLTDAPSILFEQKPWRIPRTSAAQRRGIMQLFDEDMMESSKPFLGYSAQMVSADSELCVLECFLGPHPDQQRSDDLNVAAHDIVLKSALATYVSPDQFSTFFGLDTAGLLTSMLRIAKNGVFEDKSRELFLEGRLILLPENETPPLVLRAYRLECSEDAVHNMLADWVIHQFCDVDIEAAYNDDPLEQQERAKKIVHQGLVNIHNRTIPPLRELIAG